MPLDPYGDIAFRSTEKPTFKNIIEAERREHEAKTARLREARLAKEALEPPPAPKPRSKLCRWP
jgi:hypothetical protein